MALLWPDTITPLVRSVGHIDWGGHITPDGRILPVLKADTLLTIPVGTIVRRFSIGQVSEWEAAHTLYETTFERQDCGLAPELTEEMTVRLGLDLYLKLPSFAAPFRWIAVGIDNPDIRFSFTGTMLA